MSMITVVTKNNPLYKESNMTKQINEMIQFLADNGVRVNLSDNKRSDTDTMKLLNKIVRELVA